MVEGAEDSRADADRAPEGVTRRQLLMALGAVGGAGVLLGALGALELAGDDRAAPFTPPSVGDFSLQGRANGTRVLVLGAGVAGLCCAYELGKAGYSVTVLDARTRVGGRNCTIRGGDEIVDTRGDRQHCEFADGRWFNPGPARIAQHHTTLSYCRELGVPVEVLINVNTDAYVESDGTVRRRRAVQGDLDGYVSELLTKAVSHRALDVEVPFSEREALVEYLQQIGALGRGDRGYEKAPLVYSGQVGTPDDLATLLQLGFGEVLAFEREFDQAAPMFHPVGGMDAIPRAFARAAGATLRLGHEVTEVRTTTDGVEVTAVGPAGRPATFRADAGICTLPPVLAAELTTNWDPDVRRALGEATPDPSGKLGLEYDRRFWELDHRIFGGITHCDPAIRNIWYPSTDYFGDGGVLVGAYPAGPDAQRFSEMSPADRVAMGVRIGESIHGPAYREELRSAVSVDWATQKYSRAAWCFYEQYGASFYRMQRNDGRWWFAGDWLTRNTGWQHSSLESARRAITDLHRCVLNDALVTA